MNRSLKFNVWFPSSIDWSVTFYELMINVDYPEVSVAASQSLELFSSRLLVQEKESVGTDYHY